jgi:hypothetical protein
MQTDWGGEYEKLNSFFQKIGITHHVSCPHAHQQNGSAERKHRHIVEVGLAFLANASMPLKFWDEAFLTTTFLINLLPSKVINDDTPVKRLLQTKPNYESLRVFGYACRPNLRPYNKIKLSYRSTICVFIGYSPRHKGVKCLDTSTGRVYISRDIVFDEKVFPFASLNPNAGKRLKDEILLLPFDSPSITSNSGVANVDDYMPLPYVPSVTNPLQDAPENVVTADATTPMHTPGENSGSNDAQMPENSQFSDSEEDKMDIESEEDDSAANPGAASPATSDHAHPDPDVDSASTASPMQAQAMSPSRPRSMERPAPPSPRAASPVASARRSPLRSPPHVQPTPPDLPTSPDIAQLSADNNNGSADSPDASSSSRSFAASPAPSPHVPLVPPPPPPPVLEPRTRLQKGIINPKVYTDGTIRYGMLTSTGEPRTLPEALQNDHWRQAMQDEYNALIENKTWHLVPPNPTKNLIDCNGCTVSRNMMMVQLIDTKLVWLRKDSKSGMVLAMKTPSVQWLKQLPFALSWQLLSLSWLESTGTRC